MRIYGTQKCKQYGTHGIQFPHDIDLHAKRKVSVPKQDIGLTHPRLRIQRSYLQFILCTELRLDLRRVYLHDYRPDSDAGWFSDGTSTAKSKISECVIRICDFLNCRTNNHHGNCCGDFLIYVSLQLGCYGALRASWRKKVTGWRKGMDRTRLVSSMEIQSNSIMVLLP